MSSLHSTMSLLKQQITRQRWAIRVTLHSTMSLLKLYIPFQREQ